MASAKEPVSLQNPDLTLESCICILPLNILWNLGPNEPNPWNIVLQKKIHHVFKALSLNIITSVTFVGWSRTRLVRNILFVKQAIGLVYDEIILFVCFFSASRTKLPGIWFKNSSCFECHSVIVLAKSCELVQRYNIYVKNHY